MIHEKKGGYSIRELCELITKDLLNTYEDPRWVPGVSLMPKDLSVNTFFIFHEPITVPANPDLCVTRITLGIEPRVITKLKELTEHSKSKGSIKKMMLKITEISQENALNAVQAPIVEIESILKIPESLAAIAETLPDEDEEEDELMNKIVNEILPAVSGPPKAKRKPNPNSVANNRKKLGLEPIPIMKKVEKKSKEPKEPEKPKKKRKTATKRKRKTATKKKTTKRKTAAKRKKSAKRKTTKRKTAKRKTATKKKVTEGGLDDLLEKY